MAESEELLRQLALENFRKAVNGGPRLRYDYNIWVEARDRERGLVLIGGLGGMGVGTMWVKDHPGLVGYAGYSDAPERKGFLVHWRR